MTTTRYRQQLRDHTESTCSNGTTPPTRVCSSFRTSPLKWRCSSGERVLLQARMYWCAAPETSCGYAERDRWVLRRAAALVPLAPSLAIRNREAPGEIFCHQHSAGPWQSLRSFLNNKQQKGSTKNHEAHPSVDRVLCFAMSPRPTLCLAIATVIGAHFTGASNCEAHVTIITCSILSLGDSRP